MSAGPAVGSRRAGAWRWIFPGNTVVWWVALAVLVVLVAVFARLLTNRDPPLTGTNSVDVATVIAHADDGQRACIRDLRIPKGSDRVQVWMGATQPRPGARIQGVLAGQGQTQAVSLSVTTRAGGWQDFSLTKAPRGGPGVSTLCLTPRWTGLDLGGASVNRLPAAPVTTVAGRPLPGTDVGVRYLAPASTTFASRLGAALDRATLFKDYPGGSVLLWLILLGFPLVGYFVVRTAATVEAHSAMVLARRATGIALFAALAWALMMPPFYGADETEHFAYAQHLAATGQRADVAQGSGRPPYSTAEVTLMGALHHNSTILNTSSRPRWDDYWDTAYDRASGGVDDGDGGGYSESATGHAPLYYAGVAIPYVALQGVLDEPGLVVAMRIWNALFASLIAGLAVLTAARLFPKVPGTWWLAGCLVALQPVFSSISGTINNDTLVNLLAAVCLFLLVDAWRRGPTRWRMAGLGLATAFLPIAKITGFALWPVVGLGLALVLWRHRSRVSLGRIALVPVVVIAAVGFWVVAGSPLLGGGTGALQNVHPAVAAAPGVPAAPGPTLVDRANYFAQTVIPVVHLGRDLWVPEWPLYDIYLERGYGMFGWTTLPIRDGFISLIGYALLAGWGLALVAAVRWRARWRDWLGGASILFLAVLAVAALVSFGYASLQTQDAPGEQGRYIFPTIVALAVLLSGSLTALTGRLRWAFFGVATAVLPALAAFSWLSAVRGWFT